MKARYKRWRAVKVCGLCGEFSNGMALCKKHRLAHSKSSKKYYQMQLKKRLHMERDIARKNKAVA